MSLDKIIDIVLSVIDNMAKDDEILDFILKDIPEQDPITGEEITKEKLKEGLSKTRKNTKTTRSHLMM